MGHNKAHLNLRVACTVPPVTPDDIMRELRAASRALAAAADRADAAREKRDALIRAARKSGFGLREIADAAGVSLQRVEQIAYGGDR